MEPRLRKFIKSTWTNLNIRCGKYRHLQTKNKCKSYEFINIMFSREEYKEWCITNKDTILKLNRPSIDRIDALKNYEFNNMQVIELSANIKKKKYGNNYKNGPKEGRLRGIRLVKNRYYTRIHFQRKEIYLGVFDNKKDAYTCFYNKFLELNGYEPFNMSLLVDM